MPDLILAFAAAALAFIIGSALYLHSRWFWRSMIRKFEHDFPGKCGICAHARYLRSVGQVIDVPDHPCAELRARREEWFEATRGDDDA